MDRTSVLHKPDEDQLGQILFTIGSEILNRWNLTQLITDGLEDPSPHSFRVKEARFMTGDPERYSPPGSEEAFPEQPFGSSPEVRKGIRVKTTEAN